MRFLLKCAFWLGGVFLLMPGIMGKQADNSAPQAQSARTAPSQPQDVQKDLVEQWLHAGKTLQEISTFCDRNPALCIAGKATAQQAGEQALLRAKDTFDRFSTAAPTAQQQAHPSAPVQSGTLKIPVPTPRPQ